MGNEMKWNKMEETVLDNTDSGKAADFSTGRADGTGHPATVILTVMLMVMVQSQIPLFRSYHVNLQVIDDVSL